MKTFQIFLIFFGVLFGTSSVEAYEDNPFEFHAEVSDSVLFVLHGVEYKKFIIEYFPGDQELYLNGVPVFQLKLAPEGDDCLDFLEDIETALDCFRSGLSCSQCVSRYENNKNVLAWDIGDWLDDPEQSEQSDWLLTLKLFTYCHSYEIAPDIVRLFVWNHHAYICFATVRYADYTARKIPSVKERVGLGGRIMPFREQALAYSHSILRQVQGGHQLPKILAITRSGGSMSLGRVGAVPQGRLQLQRIAEKGEYVDGPIPKSYFEKR